ncbi:ABC transporter substrate-binding protein [Clostridium sp. 'deep sea']|uniref:ABC transporter substrate-binding protein n=1 Tax=Clostridium sp. 'deep sea' TaxID=2779445 RepID=UPI0018968A5C|nr:ABC transporter substrate-binding protein [Clostridium sp. 'deep sea']QOR36161.1 ABC transporter substrate-binding protein [Clostridium sp. 'deep sea']
MSKKFLTVLLIVVLSISIIGCNNTKATTTVAKEINICESWGFDTGFSTVVVGESLGIFYYLSNFYDTLVIYEDGKIKPGLAKSWEIQGNDITFKLRDNVKFSDGEEFNANVVKLNFENIPKLLGERYLGAYGKVLTLLKEVEVVDNLTVKLRFTKPYYGLLYDLTMLRPMAMMSPNAFTKEGCSPKLLSSTMGTGPYMLQSFEENISYTFVKNPYYWGEQPDVEKFTIKVIPDNEAKALALRLGEVDIIIGDDKTSYNSFVDFREQPNFETKISNADIKTRYFILNSETEYFRDIRVRQAVSLAIDKSKICTYILNNIEEQTDNFLSKKLPYCNVDLEPKKLNINLAKKLLTEANWVDKDGDGIREQNGKKLAIKIVHRSGMGAEEDMVLAVANSLHEIGFEVKTEGLEMLTWYTSLAKGNFDIGYNETYGFPYDPYTTINNLGSNSADPATMRIMASSKNIDNMLKELLSCTNKDRITEIYNIVLKDIYDNYTSVPISFMKQLAIYNDKISDYVFFGQPFYIDIAGVKLK